MIIPVHAADEVKVRTDQNGRLDYIDINEYDPENHSSQSWNATGVNDHYEVDTNANCTTVAKDINGNDAVLTVQNNNGDTNTIQLILGTYWVKETSVPDHYELNTTVVKFTGSTDGQTVSVDFENVLLVDKGKVQKSY